MAKDWFVVYREDTGEDVSHCLKVAEYLRNEARRGVNTIPGHELEGVALAVAGPFRGEGATNDDKPSGVWDVDLHEYGLSPVPLTPLEEMDAAIEASPDGARLSPELKQLARTIVFVLKEIG